MCKVTALHLFSKIRCDVTKTTITFGFYNRIGRFFVYKLIYFSYPVQSFGALSAISATFSFLFREVRFRKAPRGAIDVIQFKHFHKTHYKELGKKL